MAEVPLATDGVIEVKAFLRDGELLAVPSGNMATIYRVHNDQVKGQTAFEYLGIAAITGMCNTVRMWKP